jgi:hypothetical protein
MKKLFALSALMVFLLTTATAQPIPEKQSEGFSPGKLTLQDNSVIAGTIKDNIRKKGELILLREGKKTKFKANDLTSAEIEGSIYISYNNAFYELIWQGNNLTLYRKASTSSGIQFNGTEPIVTGSSDSGVDDLFVKKNGDASFYLLSKKNLKEVLGKLCSKCTITLDTTTTDTDNIKKAVADCDNCK